MSIVLVIFSLSVLHFIEHQIWNNFMVVKHLKLVISFCLSCLNTKSEGVTWWQDMIEILLRLKERIEDESNYMKNIMSMFKIFTIHLFIFYLNICPCERVLQIVLSDFIHKDFTISLPWCILKKSAEEKETPDQKSIAGM